MNWINIILSALGVFMILFFVFCWGMAYQARELEKAVKAGKDIKLPDGTILHVKRRDGGEP